MTSTIPARHDTRCAATEADLNPLPLEERIRLQPGDHAVVSGDRPTGPLHLGHYIGTLANRVRLQNSGVGVRIVIADYQVIADRAETGPLRQLVRTLVAEYLAAGIDPDRSMIFAHSSVPALNQLMLPFLSLVTDAELRRNPTVKAESLASRRPLSGLLLTYPVHQAADILGLRGDVVPVGRDQLPHVEVARVIARRFNDRYGTVFTEPEALLTSTPTVLGVDGAKMSKTRGNTVLLGATEDETAAAIRGARTDGLRRITFDPVSRPQVSNLLAIIGALTERDPVQIGDGIGEGGAVALKTLACEVINESLRGLRDRRRELLGEPDYLDGVLLDGTVRAAQIAAETLDRVRAVMGMNYLAPMGDDR